MYDDYLNAKVSQKKTDEFTVHRKGGWGSLDETTARLHLESEVNICQKNKKRMFVHLEKNSTWESYKKNIYHICIKICSTRQRYKDFFQLLRKIWLHWICGEKNVLDIKYEYHTWW